MEQTSKIFTALSAGAHCLWAYPGIFSGLSNDGKQSPALVLEHSLPPLMCAEAGSKDAILLGKFLPRQIIRPGTSMLCAKVEKTTPPNIFTHA